MLSNLPFRFFRNPDLPREDGGTTASEFRPLPLLSNPHLQTLLASCWSGHRFNHPTREQILWLSDGDGMLLYDSVPSGWQPGDKMALLLHGLTGSHQSPQIERTALRLLELGVRTVRVDLRSAGRGIPLARRTYHGGCSKDIRAVLAEMHRWSPHSPITLAGISLGGNLALKLAGEAAADPVMGLDRVVAIGPPIDVCRCSTMLSLPRNRMYENYFLGKLLDEARLRRQCFPDLPPLRFPRRLTMRVFDDLYTAPMCGFTDAFDYYARASSLPLVPKISVPTLIITARDDPFIAVEPIASLPKIDSVTVQIVSHGGHIGFLGWDGKGGVRWAENRIVEWVLRTDLPTRATNGCHKAHGNGNDKSTEETSLVTALR